MARHIFAALAVALTTISPVLAQGVSTEPAPAAPSAICYYAGLEYSQWAQLPNGQICQPDGTWTYPQKDGAEEPAAEAAAAG
ncbi:MAG TPA: hypothetical protein VG757_10745 [Devosia sp.]|nr:hypothetical protein [Devosia sp.]